MQNVCFLPIFSPLPPPPPPPSLSFWGSGHRLVLIFLGSFMFIPTVTACSFCFCFLAVDVVDICMKRTGMSASLHSLPPPPPTPTPSTYTVLSLRFHLCSFSPQSLKWPRHTWSLCVLVLPDIGIIVNCIVFSGHHRETLVIIQLYCYSVWVVLPVSHC